MKMIASSCIIALTLTASLVSCQGGNSVIRNILGAPTALGMAAAASEGASQYFAPDGPIQPGATAIGALPLRGAEAINSGLSHLSSDLHNGARSTSQAAGRGGDLRMPGMQALDTMQMPSIVNDMGGMLRNGIRQKNNFIRGQAEAGIEAGDRLRSSMQQGLSGFQSRMGSASGLRGMMSSATNSMSKGVNDIRNQLESHLGDTMGRLSSIQGMGQNVRSQAQGLTRTLSNGLQGAASQLHRTGEQMVGQLQSGHRQNTQMMSNMVGSMQGSMGKAGQNMQKNIGGLVEGAQSMAQQVASHVQEAVQKPLQAVQSLGSNLMGGMSGGKVSSSGRY